jgi:hypothetical protein
MAATTNDAQARIAALTSSRLFGADLLANCRMDEPMMPPRLAPPPMNPKSRLACRGSKMSLASVQNWLMSRMPRMSPKR